MTKSIIALIFLMLLSQQDIRKKRLALPLLLTFLITSAGMMVFEGNYRLGLAGFAEGVLLYLIAKLTREQIGKGDAVVMMGTGMLHGALYNLELFFTALGLCAIFTVFALLFLRWNRRRTIPFIPFMTVAQILLLVGRGME